MNASSGISVHILAIAAFLSVTWGLYLIGTIRMYQQAKSGNTKIRTHDREMIVAFRRIIVALCAWLFVFSFVFRTAAVLFGVGDDVVGQIIFFTLLGSNVLGSLYCCISLWFD